MHIVSCIAALSLVPINALALAVPLASHYVTPRSLQKYPFTRRQLPVVTIQQELGPQLSNTSLIFGSDNSQFENATERFNIFSRPDVQVVVEPGTESDVSTIITYCNDNSIEFFAYGRGHGISTSVASFQGLQINLGQLNAITIAEDGKSARFQGGLDNGQVLGNVWDQGYVTTTGTATCVGLLGAGLGGGHGVYEGQYGLVIDNLIHVNIVLANGTAIGVNETSYPDLWWGIRGAGHNFGIVTSADMKIYPREIETWHYKNYWWAGEKLEEVLEALNTFHTSDNGTTPPLMGFEAGQFTMNTSVSETEATLFWSFAYAGTGEEAEKLLEPFNAIENLGVRSGDTGLPSLSNDMSAFGEGAACAPIWFVGASTLIGQYNITAMRQVYDLYNSKAAEYPELGASSQIYIEGYATKGMEVVPADTTAYPHRDKKHIIFIQFSLAEGSELHDTAEAWAKQTWDLWVEGEGPGAQPAHYVNYVLWNPWETRESIYGPEPWRLERLNQLKGQYDPENRFRFYVPILE